MEISGKLFAKFDEQQITDTFRKREFVIEYADNPMYPQFVKFELIQDKCGLIDSFNVGDEILIQFNLKGREWTNKDGQKLYFNTLDAWRIQPAHENTSTSQAVASPSMVQEDLPTYNSSDAPQDDDDLPF